MTAQFKLTSPVDFVALAPVVLGFQPEQSLVMMTVNKFHARVDLPGNTEEIKAVIDSMLAPALKYDVDKVAFVIFDGGDHSELETALLEDFTQAGVGVIAALQVSDGNYRGFRSSTWTPLDVSSNHVTLEAQFHNLAPHHSSRAELVASIQPCGEIWTDDVLPAVAELQQDGIDSIVVKLCRENAQEAVELWTQALRGSESGSALSSDIAVVLAISAWLLGHGALAWAALDLSNGTSKWHSPVESLLEQAVDPSTWPVKASDV